MEIPAWLFISFWAIISITFLHLGFHALDKTELSHSVSPVVMFLFKHSLAVSSCFSSSYALKSRAQSRYAVHSSFVLSVYLCFSSAFRRTIEGLLMWHVLKVIFGWLLCFLSKLKIFFGMIFRFLWKILLVIGVIIIALLLYFIPPSLILSTIYWVAGLIFISLYNYIQTHAFSWLFSLFQFLLFPLITFSGICSAILSAVVCLGLFCILIYSLILVCKDNFYKLILARMNNFSELETRAVILMALEMSIFFVSENKIIFFPTLVLSISHFISVCLAAHSRIDDYTLVSGDPLWDGASVGLVRIATKFVALKMKEVLSKMQEHKAKKFIEFAVGMMGAVLFQNFFRITSFSEVAAFLCFAVMWLANLVLLGFCGDFGVFNFLLGNVVVGCTVGQFGLHGATWLALGAALLLFALRLKLESVAIAYEEARRIQFSFFCDKYAAPPHHLPL